MEKSTHRVEVVRLGPITKHPNADSLGLTNVWGYNLVVRLADWSEGTLGAYIPPDSIVPDTEAFAFLKGHLRIRVRRFRGILSQGLLVPAPDGAVEGDDVAEQLGVTHYEPPLPLSSGGETAPPPKGYHPVYDVDALRRFGHVFEPGELVFVTEKLHGASGRYVWADGHMHVGSKSEWKQESASNLWWRALDATPTLRAFCEVHPEFTVYGEVYGQVQDLKYGAAKGEVRFAAFDLLRGNGWLGPEEMRALLLAAAVPCVPLLIGPVPFDFDMLVGLAEGPSAIPGADHVREGIVVRPQSERTHPEVGRVHLKLVSNGYLERG